MIKFLLLLSTSFSLYGISQEYLQGKDAKLIESKELLEYEAKLDKQIQDLNREIEKYILLTKYAVDRTPENVSYKITSEYLEISTYTSEVIRHKIVSIYTKTLRVFYKGDKFTKSHIILANQNYTEHSYFTDIVIDVDPLKLSKDDVEVLSKFLENFSRLKFIEIENTVAVPNRTKLKRDFYIPTLQYFLNLLKLTHEYQIKREIRKEGRMLNEFQRSKRY